MRTCHDILQRHKHGRIRQVEDMAQTSMWGPKLLPTVMKYELKLAFENKHMNGTSSNGPPAFPNLGPSDSFFSTEIE